MFLPVPYLTLLAVAIVVTVLWWWLSRVRVVPEPPAPVAVMPQRIAFPGGVVIHDPQAALAKLDQPDEIVIPYQHAVLVIDARMPIGFTRATLIKMICEEYAHVYDAEEGTAATKTIPLAERGTLR